MKIKTLFTQPRAKILLAVGLLLILVCGLIFGLAQLREEPQAPTVSYDSEVLLDLKNQLLIPTVALPEQSNLQMIVRITAEGKILGESAPLSPAEPAPKIPCVEVDRSAGESFEGEIILLFLNPATKQEITQTAIPVTITAY